jgi:hypothetical protein
MNVLLGGGGEVDPGVMLIHCAYYFKHKVFSKGEGFRNFLINCPHQLMNGPISDPRKEIEIFICLKWPLLMG